MMHQSYTKSTVIGSCLALLLLALPVEVNAQATAENQVPAWWNNYRHDGRLAHQLSGRGSASGSDREDVRARAIKAAERDLQNLLIRNFNELALQYAQKHASDEGRQAILGVAQRQVDLYMNKVWEPELEEKQLSDGKTKYFALIKLNAKTLPEEIAVAFIAGIGTERETTDLVEEWRTKIREKLELPNPDVVQDWSQIEAEDSTVARAVVLLSKGSTQEAVEIVDEELTEVRKQLTSAQKQLTSAERALARAESRLDARGDTGRGGQFTLKGGMVLGDMVNSPDDEMATGFAVGFGLTASLNRTFDLDVDFLWARKGVKFESGDYTVTSNLDYVVISPMLRFPAGSPLSFYVGVEAGYLHDANQKISVYDEEVSEVDIVDLFNRADISYCVGVRLGRPAVYFDGRFVRSMGTLVHPNTDDETTQAIYLMLGVGL